MRYLAHFMPYYVYISIAAEPYLSNEHLVNIFFQVTLLDYRLEIKDKRT